MSTDERARLIDTATPSLALDDEERRKNCSGGRNGGGGGGTASWNNGDDDDDEEASPTLLLPATPTSTTTTTTPAPPPQQPPPSSSPSPSSLSSLLWNSGTACVLTSAATRSGSAAALKGIDHRVRALVVVLVRSLAALALTALARARSRELRASEPFFGKPGARPLLFARGLVSAGAILFFYSAVERLPLADALALNFLSPVVAALMSWAVHGENPGPSGLAAAAATVVGVALVAQPESLFGDGGGGGVVGGSGVFRAPDDAVVSHLASSSSSSYPSSSPSSDRAVGVFLAIVSAFCAASGFTILRSLSARPEGPPAALTTAAYFHVCSFVGSVLPLMFEASAAVATGEPLPGIGAPGAGPPRFPTDLLLAVVLVGGGFVGQTLMNRAFLLEPAAKMAALNTTQVLDGHVYGLLFLGEQESALGMAGSALIVGGAVTAALAGGRGGGGGKGKGRGKGKGPEEEEEDKGGAGVVGDKRAGSSSSSSSLEATATATIDPKAAAEAAASPAAAITPTASDVELASVSSITSTRPSPSRSAAGATFSGRHSSSSGQTL